MTYVFALGAVVGIIVLVVEALRHQWPLSNKEGLAAFVFYPTVIGWGFCFIWKIIQWPFL